MAENSSSRQQRVTADGYLSARHAQPSLATCSPGRRHQSLRRSAGSLEAGKAADVVIIGERRQVPFVAYMFRGGCEVAGAGHKALCWPVSPHDPERVRSTLAGGF
jgi:hypothetical protein